MGHGCDESPLNLKRKHHDTFLNWLCLAATCNLFDLTWRHGDHPPTVTNHRPLLQLVSSQSCWNSNVLGTNSQLMKVSLPCLYPLILLVVRQLKNAHMDSWLPPIDGDKSPPSGLAHPPAFAQAHLQEANDIRQPAWHTWNVNEPNKC